MLDRDDAMHARAAAALARIREPLVTLWPPLTEAMHLLGDSPRATDAVCDMVADGAITIAALDDEDFGRMKALMAKYRDLPMDFADAAIVTAAERHGIARIVTFDRHFALYRLPRRARFVVLDGG